MQLIMKEKGIKPWSRHNAICVVEPLSTDGISLKVDFDNTQLQLIMGNNEAGHIFTNLAKCPGVLRYAERNGITVDEPYKLVKEVKERQK